jgi:hypothetical protein
MSLLGLKKIKIHLHILSYSHIKNKWEIRGKQAEKFLGVGMPGVRSRHLSRVLGFSAPLRFSAA